MKRVVLVGIIALAFNCGGGSPANCTNMVACSSGSYAACTDGARCWLAASDGTRFDCSSCGDCAAATTKAASWCGLPAVGGSGGVDGGNVDGGRDSGNGTVAIVVNTTDEPLKIGGTGPSSGRIYVTVDLTLTNANAPSPIPASQVDFTMKTNAGLVLMAAPQSANLTPPCPTDIALSTGANIECKLAFEVPTQDAPSLLDYDDLRGDTGSVTVPSYTPTACEQLFAFQHWDSNPCTSCRDQVFAMGGACYAQAQAANQCLPSSYANCAMSCPGIGSADDPATACSCSHACAPDCSGQMAAWESCVVGACASQCK